VLWGCHCGGINFWGAQLASHRRHCAGPVCCPPLSGWTSLAGYPASSLEKAAIAFFGICGLGLFYYVAYALGQAEFEGTPTVWVSVCSVVLVSIVIHGVLVAPVMRHLDYDRSAQPPL
jgi:NhaP-type Na+/H+ or K+/H+ antiporter